MHPVFHKKLARTQISSKLHGSHCSPESDSSLVSYSPDNNVIYLRTINNHSVYFDTNIDPDEVYNEIDIETSKHSLLTILNITTEALSPVSSNCF